MRSLKLALAVTAGMSMTVGTTAARAAVCQPGPGGCVLPLPGPVAAPPIQTPGPAPAAPVVVDTAAPIIEEAGFNFLPFVLGALALAAVGAFFLFDDDEEGEPSP